MLSIHSHFSRWVLWPALFFGLFPFCGAQELRVKPAAVSVNLGQEFVLEIEVADITDLYGFQFDILYDSAVLEYVSFSYGPFLSRNGQDATFSMPPGITPGLVNNCACVRLGDVGGVSGSGILGSVRLRVIAAKQSSIVLENVILVDSNSATIPGQIFNGLVNVIGQHPSAVEDFVGTWDGQGVYYRNSDTETWDKMASPATMIVTGDLDGDGIDDLIGLWPGQGGIWVKYSSSGEWAKLSSTAVHIAAGDMNGDSRADLVGTWDGQGVFYRDSISGAWVMLASPATMITTGDIDGDGTDDLIGVWPSQGGVWVKYSSTGLWEKLSSTARDIAAGDMDGNGRDDLLATWDGQGVYYRDSITGGWFEIGSQAEQVTCGDLDGDGTADLIGIWSTQGGVWVKYSDDGTWECLSSTAQDITAGAMRSQGGSSEAAEGGDAGLASQAAPGLPLPMGGDAGGPERAMQKLDISDRGPGGERFVFVEDINLEPRDEEYARLNRNPGPGEPGFVAVEQKLSGRLARRKGGATPRFKRK